MNNFYKKILFFNFHNYMQELSIKIFVFKIIILLSKRHILYRADYFIINFKK